MEISLPTPDDIAQCDNPEALVEALWETSFNLLGNIERMAAIIRRLDELGAKIEFDHALLPYLRLVSQGKLLGQCLVAMSGDPMLLEQAMQAPLDVQQRLAAGDWFEVLGEDGGVRELIPFEMTRRDILLVFDHGRVRTVEQQRALLCDRAVSPRSIAVKKVHEVRRKAANLPKIAGEVVPGSTRCDDCGVKLLPGAECLACKLRGDEVSELEDEEDRSEFYCRASKERLGIDDEAMPDGWEDRLASVRAAKESGNEVKFHADWIIARVAKGQIDPEDEEALSDLLDVLSHRFIRETAA